MSKIRSVYQRGGKRLPENRDALKLSDIVGGGYADYWDFKGRYRVCKGSRASKKSKTTALNFIVRMMQYPDANLLVVRKVYSTLTSSCYTELKWAINRLGVDEYWYCRQNPLEMTYKPTGQKIYFRGLDDPLKVTSITVEHGYLCWLWLEEAYEVGDESQFDILNESIRGAIPPETGLFKQVSLTFNPWNENHWLKRRFFDPPPSPDVLAKTTNYLCNEWLDESDLRVFEDMKKYNPRRYRVAGLGEWGVSEGTVYEHWEEKTFDYREIVKTPGTKSVFGLDFGYVADPSALFCGLIDLENHVLWVFDEMYGYGMTNEDIAHEIRKMGFAKERIRADAAEPKSIDRLRELGISHIRKARKGKDSIIYGISNLQNFKIFVHPKCTNFITEISNYTWDKDKKTGERINKPIDDFNHLMDAMRYATEDAVRGTTFSFE